MVWSVPYRSLAIIETILSKLGVEDNIEQKEEFSLYKMLGKHNR